MKTKRTYLIGIFSAIALALPVLANPLIVPMAIGLEIITLMGVGAAIEMNNGLPEPAVAVGSRALSVTIQDSSGAVSGAASLPLTSSADSVASIPPPVAPATTSPVIKYQLAIGLGPANTPMEACQNYVSYAYTPGTATVTSATYPGSCNWLYYGVPLSTSIGQVSVCPDGYSASGSVCNLTNARATDAKKDYSRTGQAFVPYSGEPASPLDVYLSASTVSVANDTISINGKSPSGEARNLSVTNTADGGSTVKAITQKVDGAGVSYVEQKNYTVSPNGYITGASSSALQGGLSQNSTTGALTYNGTGSSFAPASEQKTNTSPCGGVGQPKCSIDDSGFSGKDAGGAAALAALTEQSALKTTAENELKNMANPYSASWVPSLMPGEFEGCQPFSWHVAINHGPMAGFTSDHSFDICPQFAFVRIIFGWLFYVMTVLYIVRVFFNSNKGA